MALQLEIDSTEWARLGDKLDGANEIVEREIRLATRKAVSVIETNIVGFTPLGATKNLSQSWATEVKTIPAGIRGEVFSTLSYASAVEAGRRPGKMPPIEPIRLWVVRKGIASGDDARSVAFMIARAIGRRGTKPGARMIKKGVKRSLPMLQQIYNEVPRRLIAALAKP